MKIASEVLGQQAYKLVKEMILSKQLEPGKKIVQDKLAAELGISRTPLRAALLKLESENLIESIPRRGVVVKQFSKEEIIEIYDCRIALECTAVRLFSKKVSPTQILNLAKLFQVFVDKDTIDQKKYQKADSQFHSRIVANCGNRYLHKIFTTSNMLACIDLIGLVRPPEETLLEHLAIIRAIEKSEVSKAEQLMFDHLEKSKSLIEKQSNG